MYSKSISGKTDGEQYKFSELPEYFCLSKTSILCVLDKNVKFLTVNLQECTNSATCKSFDYSSENNQCYIHTREESTIESSGDIRTGVTGVDRYVKVENCRKSYILYAEKCFPF